MRSSKLIHVVTCHAEGEVGDVIVGGVPAPEKYNFAGFPIFHNFISSQKRPVIFNDFLVSL